MQVMWPLPSRVRLSSNLTLLGSCHITCMKLPFAECTVDNSWWWAKTMPETCRVLWQNKFWIFDASTSSWLFYTEHNTVLCCDAVRFVINCWIFGGMFGFSVQGRGFKEIQAQYFSKISVSWYESERCQMSIEKAVCPGSTFLSSEISERNLFGFHQMRLRSWHPVRCHKFAATAPAARRHSASVHLLSTQYYLKEARISYNRVFCPYVFMARCLLNKFDQLTHFHGVLLNAITVINKHSEIFVLVGCYAA